MKYEYECRRCGRIERDFPIGGAPDKVLCGCGRAARRVYSAPGIVFRGWGWARKELARDSGKTWQTE